MGWNEIIETLQMMKYQWGDEEAALKQTREQNNAQFDPASNGKT